MNKLTLIALLILTGISFNSFAQIEFLKGFIVKGSDTINCYIKKEPLQKLQYNITVKNSTETKEEQTYTPDDLNGFFIENFGYFISKEISVRIVNDIMMSTDYWVEEDEVFIKEKVFIKVLTSGLANLYSFFDKKKHNHYFIQKDTLFFELYEKKKFIFSKNPADNKDMNRYLSVTKNFLGKLAYVFNDCSNIKTKIEKVKLTETSLTKIANEYNKCMGYRSEENVKAKKLIFEKSVCVGLSLNNFFFYGNENRDIFINNVQPYNQSVTGGFNFNFIFPRISYDFGFYTGLLYSNNKFIATYDTMKSDLLYTYDVDLNTHFIKVPLLFRYTLNSYQIKPYIFGGVFINYAIKGNNNLRIHTTEENIDRIEDTYFFEIFHASDYKYHQATRRIEFGYSLGVGIKKGLFKKSAIFFETRYEVGSGISSAVGFGATSKYYSFVTGIEF